MILCVFVEYVFTCSLLSARCVVKFCVRDGVGCGRVLVGDGRERKRFMWVAKVPMLRCRSSRRTLESESQV
jgi:hypothetical protein